jgi:hypothetical protein
MIKFRLIVAAALIGGVMLSQSSAQTGAYNDRINGGQALHIDRTPERLDAIANTPTARSVAATRGAHTPSTHVSRRN